MLFIDQKRCSGNVHFHCKICIRCCIVDVFFYIFILLYNYICNVYYHFAGQCLYGFETTFISLNQPINLPKPNLFISKYTCMWKRRSILFWLSDYCFLENWNQFNKLKTCHLIFFQPCLPFYKYRLDNGNGVTWPGTIKLLVVYHIVSL